MYLGKTLYFNHLLNQLLLNTETLLSDDIYFIYLCYKQEFVTYND